MGGERGGERKSDRQSLGERIGRNIRDLRGARGQTQQQMARLSGLPRATWQHLE
jgi:DNA-binding XRE family transcriptional regulator